MLEFSRVSQSIVQCSVVKYSRGYSVNDSIYLDRMMYSIEYRVQSAEYREKSVESIVEYSRVEKSRVWQSMLEYSEVQCSVVNDSIVQYIVYYLV